MTVTNNDGWQAKRQIECAYDIGGYPDNVSESIDHFACSTGDRI
jgi:hypothetical protein